MSYIYEAIDGTEMVDDCAYTYSTKSGDDDTRDSSNFVMQGYSDKHESIFYLCFNDNNGPTDEEGFLLMCSESELRQLVNYLRVLRNV